MIAAIGLLLLAFLAQAAWWRRAPVLKPVGDEYAYIRGADEAAPHRPEYFLRVPVMAWLARDLRAEYPEGTARRLRFVSIAAGLAAFALTLWNAEFLGGSAGLLVAGVVMLALMERLILSQHIWPDPLLGLVHALLIAIVLSPTPGSGLLLLTGVLSAFAVLVRIDQVVILPALVLALSPGAASFEVLGLIFGPSIIALIAWTWRNGRRYGIWAPDTTAAFNLEVMRNELGVAPGDQRVVEQLVASARSNAASTGAFQTAWRAISDSLRSPLRALRDLLIRVVSMLGPDTFVSQRLLPPLGRAYSSAPRSLRIGLRVGWPVTIGLLVTGLIANPVLPPALYPTLAAFMAFVAVHSRTRYRLACLPGLAVWLALVLPGAFDHPGAIAAGALVAFVLIAWVPRQEDVLSPPR